MANNLTLEQRRNLRQAVLYEDPSGKLYMQGYYDLTNKPNVKGWWSQLIPPQFIGSEKISFQWNQQYSSPPPNLKRVDENDPRRQRFLDGLQNYLNHILFGGKGRKTTKRNKKSSKLRSKKYNKSRSKKRTIRKH